MTDVMTNVCNTNGTYSMHCALSLNQAICAVCSNATNLHMYMLYDT